MRSLCFNQRSNIAVLCLTDKSSVFDCDSLRPSSTDTGYTTRWISPSFFETMDGKCAVELPECRLKKLRENRGLSQAELARISAVSLRSIQMYEQRVNDIDKAQAQTVYKLSRVIGCTMEDLLERPME